VSSTTFPLIVLLLALVVTRPLEERRWRAGRLSDRAATWLVVGRIPVLALGFGLIVGLPPLELVLLVAVAAAAAFLLQPVARGRLLAVKARDRSS